MSSKIFRLLLGRHESDLLEDMGGRRCLSGTGGRGSREPLLDHSGQTGRHGSSPLAHEPGQGVPPKLGMLERRDPVPEHRRPFPRFRSHFLQDADDLFLKAAGPVVGEVSLPGLGDPRRGSQGFRDPADPIEELDLLATAELPETPFRDPVRE